MTKEMIKERLLSYRKAEQAILNGAQSYASGKFNLTRADLGMVQRMIKDLENQLEALEAGYNPNRPRAKRVVPRDL